jgi:hypothetical protein
VGMHSADLPFNLRADLQRLFRKIVRVRLSMTLSTPIRYP